MRPRLVVSEGDPGELATRLERAWACAELVALAEPAQHAALAAALGPDPGGDLTRFGAGVVVGSGGSTGGRQWCLQPLAHLQASADATGRWLGDLGLDPMQCLHLNPLPLHHVSGLLPLVRARRWGAQLRWLPAQAMRHPQELAQACPLPTGRPVLISLVPTQLQRLMASPDGLAWLAGCAVIWVGGAPLPAPLANQARRAGLALSPCYGATETAAMVCALPPGRFLAGEGGCGHPLGDVELRLDHPSTAVEVRTPRLSPGRLQAGVLRPLPLARGGWWRSGDGGVLAPGGLEIQGRLDGAISSGGETVFPDQVEQLLRRWVRRDGLALGEMLLLPRADPVWGERLVGLYRPPVPAHPIGDEAAAPAVRLGQELTRLSRELPPSQRPVEWIHCSALERDGLGKWQRGRWQAWLGRMSGPD